MIRAWLADGGGARETSPEEALRGASAGGVAWIDFDCEDEAVARRTLERRDVDLGPERRFVHRDRHREVDVVALAMKQLVRLHVHGDVEVAVVAAVAAGVSFAGDADA